MRTATPNPLSLRSFGPGRTASYRGANLPRAVLALQLQFHLKMRLLGGGLMRSSPEGPSDNARWLDALLREPYGYAANFLKGPADKRRATKIWGIVCCAGIALAR